MIWEAVILTLFALGCLIVVSLAYVCDNLE